MDAPEKKIFLHLDEDFSCQYKDIQFPTIQPPYFHSHNGYEILLLLGGELDFFMNRGAGSWCGAILYASVPMPSTPQGRLIPPVTTGSSSISGENRFPVLKQQPDRSVLLLFRVPPAMLNLTHLSDAEIERFTCLARDLQSALSSGEWGSEHSLPLSPPADSRHAQPACGRAFRCEPGRHARLYGGALFLYRCAHPGYAHHRAACRARAS